MTFLTILILALVTNGTQAVILQIDPRYPYFVSAWNDRVYRLQTTAYCAGYQMTDALTQAQLNQVLALCNEGKMKDQDQWWHNVYWWPVPGEVVSEARLFFTMDSYNPQCAIHDHYWFWNAWSRAICTPNGTVTAQPPSGGSTAPGNSSVGPAGNPNSGYIPIPGDASGLSVSMATMFFNLIFVIFQNYPC